MGTFRDQVVVAARCPWNGTTWSAKSKSGQDSEEGGKVKTHGTTYGPAFKFRVVLEALKAEGEGAKAQVAGAMGASRDASPLEAPVPKSRGPGVFSNI